MSYIEIKTERLLIVPLSTKFLKTCEEYALNYENTKYMLNLPRESSDEILEFLKVIEEEWAKDEPRFYEFAILHDDRHIGAIDIEFNDEGIGEIGWILNMKYQGQGYAFEAAEAMIEYFIKEKGVKHFIAHCDGENVASYKLMEKLGMIRTAESGGRRNRAATKDSIEYQYELVLDSKSKKERPLIMNGALFEKRKRGKVKKK